MISIQKATNLSTFSKTFSCSFRLFMTPITRFLESIRSIYKQLNSTSVERFNCKYKYFNQDIPIRPLFTTSAVYALVMCFIIVTAKNGHYYYQKEQQLFDAQPQQLSAERLQLQISTNMTNPLFLQLRTLKQTTGKPHAHTVHTVCTILCTAQSTHTNPPLLTHTHQSLCLR